MGSHVADKGGERTKGSELEIMCPIMFIMAKTKTFLLFTYCDKHVYTLDCVYLHSSITSMFHTCVTAETSVEWKSYKQDGVFTFCAGMPFFSSAP